MPKKLLFLVALLPATISTYAQGTLLFNTQVTGQRIGFGDAKGIHFMSGSAFLAQLYASPTLDGALEPIAKAYNFRSGVNVGYISIPPAEQVVTVPSVINGGDTYLQLRAWDAAYPSYDDAVAAGGLAGASRVWIQDTGAFATSTSPPEPPPLISGFEGLCIACTPEPSMVALMGVGAAAFLFFRRK